MRSDPERIALREGDYEYAWGVAAIELEEKLTSLLGTPITLG